MSLPLGSCADMPWRSGHDVRVAVLLERYGNVMSPCSSIRLHAFTEQFPADVRYVLVEEIERFSPNVILWNRSALSDVQKVDQLEGLGRKLGARLIYDLDDNLLAMEDHPEREAYIELVAAVHRSIVVADEVWCSTAALVDAVFDAGGKPIHMPNDLDPVLWEIGRPQDQRRIDDDVLHLVYMGTRTHDDDYRLLAAALVELERQRPGSFTLSLIGVNATALESYSWMRVLSPPAHAGASYPAFVRWFVRQGSFDLGLAPLLDTRFNRCKSAIKVLDYAAVNVPTLASSVTGYIEDFADDRLLVENTVDGWVSALRDVQDARVDLATILSRATKRLGAESFEAAVARRWDNCIQVIGA